MADAPRTAGVVIAAGGAGRRMGCDTRKQYLEVAGEPVLLRAVRPFVDHPDIAAVVVVLPPDDAADPPAWLVALPVRIVAGGAERGDSVWNGLAALPATADPILVHDGARPFVSAAVIDRVLAGARSGGAVAAVPVTDTIKQVNAANRIEGTPERSRLWQAQTPQGFPRAILFRAYEEARAAGIPATDDAALCERIAPVHVVLGAPENLKITRPADLPIAEALAADR